jgi:SAM-dependent methyltransferase
MTPTEYFERATSLGREAQVLDGVHGYFRMHRQRLWQTASRFDLWNVRGKQLLELGPFYSYTPFLIQEQGNTVTVIEGTDPVVEPLKPLYKKRGIEFIICELSQSFGSASPKDHRLPLKDGQFDVISCWETMEHFNFNPVGFVREVNRVLKPGGVAYITAPNAAALENRVKLLMGKSTRTPIADYVERYAYEGGVFLGFHWREYCLYELVQLFESQGFQVESARHLMTFQTHDEVSVPRRFKRTLGAVAARIVPGFGNLCTIVARKGARPPG